MNSTTSAYLHVFHVWHNFNKTNAKYMKLKIQDNIPITMLSNLSLERWFIIKLFWTCGPLVFIMIHW